MKGKHPKRRKAKDNPDSICDVDEIPILKHIPVVVVRKSITITQTFLRWGILQMNIGWQRDHNKSTDVGKSNICTFFDFVLYTFKKIFVIMMKQFNLYYLMLFSDK